MMQIGHNIHNALFIALCRALHGIGKHRVWRSDARLNMNGVFFILGINKEPGTQITFRLPMCMWSETDFAETLACPPAFDGHNPDDVIKRLTETPWEQFPEIPAFPFEAEQAVGGGEEVENFSIK